jgi:septal ring factor EnvC (AmiA/AmiB activator)
VAALAQQVDELEAQARRADLDRVAAAAYARELEAAVAAKNAHIVALEATVAERSRMVERYQRSIFYRAYQRWLRIVHKSS